MRRSSFAERKNSPEVLVGCCGFPRKLSEYAAALPVVEVQQTFYKPPRVQTAQRWRQSVPPSFQFALKAWQVITHPPTSPTYRRAGIVVPPSKAAEYGFFAPSEEVLAAWERTREVGLALNACIVVFQCPASFTPTQEHIANMRAFFRKVDRAGFQFAWEPRGDWPTDQIAGLCRDLDLIHCVDPFGAKPPLRFPFSEPTPSLTTPSYGQPWYFRLHGRGGYRYRYTDEELQSLAATVRGHRAYVMFNNIFMWEDALRFLQKMQKGR